MVIWDAATFAHLAKLAAGEDSDKSLDKVLRHLATLGVLDGESVTRKLEFTLSHHTISLQLPPDLSDECVSFVESLLTSLLRRKEVTKERDHAQERAEMLSHASFEGLLLHRNGDVFDVNERLSQLLRLPREALLGPNTISNCVVPEDVQKVLEKMRSGFEGSYVIEAVRGDKTRFRAELQSKQGKLGDEPIRVAAVRDVTERERMWDLLRESETQLRSLVEAVFDVTVLSRDGRCIDVSGSPEEVTGYSREALLERHVWEFVAPETREGVEALVAQRQSGTYQTIVVAKNGERVPVEIVATNTTLSGEPVRLAGVRDLREAREQEHQRAQLRRQVERAQRLDSLGALAGGVAHDFNNLLVGIMGNAELLKEDLVNNELRSFATTILEASQRAKDLTGRLLAYSGKTNLREREPIDLAQLFHELDRLTAISRPKTVHLSFEFDDACIVLGDQASITQVMLNLVTNAIDAIGQDSGTITVVGRRVQDLDSRWDEALGAQVGPGDYVQIEVTDTGEGMDSETALRAFEPFFSTKSKGHGLGLAASLGILKAHGGAVHVRSSPKEGATFAILLPSADGEPDTEELKVRSVSAPRMILIVDDQAIVRQHIVRVLKRRGYEPLEADGPGSCFDQLEHHTPDLILMDMTMPGGSGADTATELRRRGITTPIVLTSGYVPNEKRESFDVQLFQGFLQKPYSLEELDSAIEKALAPS